MSLRRFCQSVDGTIPPRALVLEHEEILAHQDGVGIYDGQQKAPHHQNGTVYATPLRLFYIDAAHPASRSFALDLVHVSQTEYYGGLFKSSSKVTFHLVNPPNANSKVSPSAGVASPDPNEDAWECHVCGNRNQPALVAVARTACVLCGVPRPPTSVAPVAINLPAERSVASSSHLSTSLPITPRAMSLSSSPAPSSATALSNQASSLRPIELGSKSSPISCPACTFLNHPYLRECELCSTPLPHVQRSTPEAHTGAILKSAPTSRPVSPDPDDGVITENSNMIKLSFRKGGDKVFYAILRRSLLGRAWESKTTRTRSSPVSSDLAMAGITGILNTVQLTTEAADVDMRDSLKDLEAFMIKARDMVRLAKELNDRLTATSSSVASPSHYSQTAQSSAVEPEEATFIRSSLAQLGLQMEEAPVTLDMMKDERRWLDELAKELSGVLQRRGARGHAEGMMQARGRGIMALDEVWGGWNRARGVALIPPSTFLEVLPLLPQHTDPAIQMRTFASGLRVLHTPSYTTGAFTERLIASISRSSAAETTASIPGRTLMQIAQEEGLTISLAAEMIGTAELAGSLCRDEANWAGPGGEVRWCVWDCEKYASAWDGQVFGD